MRLSEIFFRLFFRDILSVASSGELSLAVHAAVKLSLLIRKDKDVIELLLDRGDAARVLAFDNVDDLCRKM